MKRQIVYWKSLQSLTIRRFVIVDVNNHNTFSCYSVLPLRQICVIHGLQNTGNRCLTAHVILMLTGQPNCVMEVWGYQREMASSDLIICISCQSVKMIFFRICIIFFVFRFLNLEDVSAWNLFLTAQSLRYIGIYIWQ